MALDFDWVSIIMYPRYYQLWSLYFFTYQG